MGTFIIVLIIIGLAWWGIKKISKSSNEPHEELFSETSIEIKKNAENINQNYLIEQNRIKEKRKESLKNRTKTTVTGYKYLSNEARKIVRNELNIGDEVKLVTDPKNQYDNYAIKVMFNNTHIGWFSAKGYRQKEIFNELTNGNDIKVTILQNTKSSGYIEAKFEYNIK